MVINLKSLERRKRAFTLVLRRSGWVYDLKTGRVSAATSYLSMKGYLANYVDRFVSSFESNIKIFWSWYHM